ncbi:site-specific DNA-methyltransferase [Clostridium novyi]|nr:site-specific DNA-methyltransferase [Clostridium novyi]
MKFETEDLSQKNLEKIGKLFPNCITEAKDENGKLKKAIDFEMLKQMLSDDIVDESNEKYEFTWVGKKEAMVEANKPIKKTLRPCKEESKYWDTTENLYIEGDNLEVLKLLQESYLNSIKMIYIDPPYNTGNDFIYNDDFKMNSYEYKDETGEIDEEGNRLFKNTDTNGRFHSDWCSMMYSRLMLARNLLSDDGVIFISIDDNEQENMKKICDEVFGEENFSNNIVVKMSESSGVKMSHVNKRFPKLKEYVFLYKKDKDTKINEVKIKKDKWDDEYSTIMTGVEKTEIEYISNVIKDENRTEVELSKVEKILSKADFKGISTYVKENNIANENKFKWDNAYRIFRTCATSENFTKTVKAYIEKNSITYKFFAYKTPENKIYIIKNIFDSKSKKPRLQVIFADDYLDKNPGDFWHDIKTTGLDNEGDVPFKNGKKPLKLIKRLIKTGCNEEDIILDFFSGSATTAHAVMDLNMEDGGKRKFIMVQLPEECDEKSEAYKAGYKNICEIGKERIRRAGEKIKKDYADKEGIENLDTGFRVLKLDETNMKDVYYAPDDYTQDLLERLESNIKEDRTELDLLYGCLIEWGIPLNKSYESKDVAGSLIHIYNDGDLIACFDKDISEEAIKRIAKMEPLRVVFRDSSFKTSANKINVEEIFKLLSPDTSVRVI